MFLTDCLISSIIPLSENQYLQKFIILSKSRLVSWLLESVVCRGLMMPGTTSWLYAPLPNSSIEQCVRWSLLLDIRCLWCHNTTSYSRLQTNVLAKFVDTTCIFFYCTRTLLTPYCTIYRCDEHKLSTLQVRRPEQNTALNAKTEQFITAKKSSNAFKQGSGTHSLLYVSAVHNCKIITLRECLVE